MLAAVEFTENKQCGTERAVQCLERAQHGPSASAGKECRHVTLMLVIKVS